MNAETLTAPHTPAFTVMLTALTEPGAYVVTQYMDPEGWEVTLYRKFPGDRLRSYARRLVSTR
jgi:hypothetical protein